MKRSRTIALIPLKEGGEDATHIEATHIEVELFYSKGMKYWSGYVYRRGIYVSVSPVRLETHNGYTSKSKTLFSGVNKHLLDMGRWSAKTFERFIPSRELIDSMIEHVCAKNDFEVVDYFIFLEEEVES